MSLSPATIPEDELQDFLREVAAEGFDEGSFVLSAKEHVPVQPGPIGRIVTVERLGFTQQYDGSSGDLLP